MHPSHASASLPARFAHGQIFLADATPSTPCQDQPPSQSGLLPARTISPNSATAPDHRRRANPAPPPRSTAPDSRSSLHAGGDLPDAERATPALAHHATSVPTDTPVGYGDRSSLCTRSWCLTICAVSSRSRADACLGRSRRHCQSRRIRRNISYLLRWPIDGWWARARSIPCTSCRPIFSELPM